MVWLPPATWARAATSYACCRYAGPPGCGAGTGVVAAATAAVRAAAAERACTRRTPLIEVGSCRCGCTRAPVWRTARNWARQAACPGAGMPQALRGTSDDAFGMPVVALVMLALACEIVL